MRANSGKSYLDEECSSSRPACSDTLIDLLRYRAQHQPHQTAYIFLQDGESESGRLTYLELDCQARVIAAQLRQTCTPGERALLVYPSSLEFIAAFFGCLYAGLVAVPAYPPRANRNAIRLQAIVADADASVVLTTTKLLAQLQLHLVSPGCSSPVQWLVTDKDLLTEQVFPWQDAGITAKTLAFLQYTSGSTGTPKGVMLTHANLMYNERMIEAAFGHTDQTIFVGWLPLHHDMGLIGNVLQPLYLGIPCALMPPVAFLQKPLRWLQAISHYRATTSGAPNFAYELCIQRTTAEQRASLDLSSWDVAYSGAEPVREDTLRRFSATFESCGFHWQSFYPCYGMAETSLLVSGGLKAQAPVIFEVQEDALSQNQVVVADENQAVKQLYSKGIVGCGQTWLEQEIIIVNPEDLTRCLPEQVGEIWVAGGNVAQGYWQRPQETRETFQAFTADTGEGPFLRTGDLGFFRDKELFVTGRIKDLIIIQGRNHYPQDIELTIERSHSALRAGGGAAFGLEIEGQEQLVVVHEVERRYLRKLAPDEIFCQMRRAVSEYHDLPLYAVQLLKPGSLPKTSSGKVRRRTCQAEFANDGLNSVASWQLGETSRVPLPKVEKQPVKVLDFPDAGTIQAWLIAQVAAQLQVAPHEIDIYEPLAHYGLSSAVAVGLSGQLQDWLGQEISPTLLYDYPTLANLTQYLSGDSVSSPAQANQVPSSSPASNGLGSPQVDPDMIAIIGVGCRFPGAPTPEAFWELLQTGQDAITQVPDERWNVSALAGLNTSRWGGFLSDVDQFDAEFFSISPREATSLDPQQRLLLEVSWEALENANLAPADLAGSQTGVFVGISTSDYAQLQLNDLSQLNAYVGTGNALSIAANRLSYAFDFRGPSLAIDTACSSSLVAVHQACQSLRQEECSLALVGGVNLMLTHQLTTTFSLAQMMAPDGRCKAFDADANGYVRGEGCGMVVLKRLADAIADNDSIFGVILGSAINQDGCSNGLTAPNGLAQQDVIRQALNNASVEPSQVSYVEAHGTGTSLGDPIEMNALKTVLMQEREQDSACWIASLKTNIGHLEAAAGIAGLIKVVLSLHYGRIPPHLHFKQLNPYIKLENTPLKIPTALTDWPLETGRVAGISSFGFGGTNAHVVLSGLAGIAKLAGSGPDCQTNSLGASVLQHDLHLLTISAKDEGALRALAQRYREFLLHHPDVSVVDLCFSANTGRSHFDHRLALVHDSVQKLTQQLEAVVCQEEAVGYLKSNGGVNLQKSLQIACLFTGQGSQYVDMGKRLYATQSVFRQALDRCSEILDAWLDIPLLQVLYPQHPSDSSSNGSSNTATLIHQTAYAQPALFSLEYALYQLWESWGIEPTVFMGHSVGEYVAAWAAGVFSLEDGLKLIAARGRLMQQLPSGGGMVSLMASVERVRAAIALSGEETVAIAAINGPSSTVISGPESAVQGIVTQLDKDGVKHKILQVSHAFHSSLMQPMLAEFKAVAQQVSYALPQRKFVSNITGQLATDAVASPDYWCQHILSPVNFAAGIKSLHQTCDIFLECGPKPILLGMGQQFLPADGKAWLPSLRPRQNDWQQMLTSLGELYIRGVKINWHGVYPDAPQRQKIALPTYPFQRQRYWCDSAASSISDPDIRKSSLYSGERHPILGYRLSPPAPWADAYVWDVVVDDTYLTWLKDHQVWHTVIMPHTGYLQIALEATQAAFQEPWNQITNLKLYYPLFLSSQGDQRVQVVLTPRAADQCQLQIYSCRLTQGDAAEDWTLYADANVSRRKSIGAGPPKSSGEMPMRSTRNGSAGRMTAVKGGK